MGDFLDDTILSPTENDIRKLKAAINVLKRRGKDTQFRNEVIGFLECMVEEIQLKVDGES